MLRTKSNRWLAFTTPLTAILMAAPAAIIPQTGWSQQLEEITVTARRSEENVQEIPVAVTAFDSEFIEKQGVVNTQDVLKLVPGVTFDQSFSSNDTRISIRGINSSRGRTSVAVLVDGIDVTGESVTVGGGSSLLNSNLLDLERVEVVKGPQSALYGRSAFAGAINYITKKPNLEEADITVSGDYGTDNTYSMKASASGPVIKDTLALGLTAASYQSDGYYTNKLNGQDLNGYDNTGVRLSALWTPTDTLEISSYISYQDNESDPRAVAKVGRANRYYDANGNDITGQTDPNIPNSNIAYGNWLGTIGSISESDVMFSNRESGGGGRFSGTDSEQWLAAVKVAWDINSVTFRSKTSYLNDDTEINEDVDYQDGLGSCYFGACWSLANEFLDDTETDQFNQEFTLESNDWDRGRWLVGVQYYREEVDNTDNSLNWYNDEAGISAFNFCGNNPGQFPCNAQQSQINGTPAKTISRDTDSYSIFGLVSYDLTDKLTATLEARFIKDEIEVETNTLFNRVNQTIFGFNQVQPTKDDTNTREFNPRGALDYQLTEDVMLYGSIARGTKPGGYGTAQFARPTIDEAQIDPEELWAYEVGAKTEWFDNTLRANVAFYLNEYDDRQVGITVCDPVIGCSFPASGLTNAASAETKGMEVTLQWLATDNLTLGLGYAYIDAEFDDFDYRDIRPDEDPVDGQPDLRAKDLAICDQNGDCSGAEVSGVPENSLTLIADFVRPLGSSGLDLFANANAVWEDERALNDAKRTAFVDDRWVVDAQIGIQTEVWSAMVFATNLFDDDTVAWAQGQQPDFRDGNWNNFGPRDDTAFAFLPDPRIVGVRGSYRFGL